MFVSKQLSHDALKWTRTDNILINQIFEGLSLIIYNSDSIKEQLDVTRVHIPAFTPEAYLEVGRDIRACLGNHMSLDAIFKPLPKNFEAV